MQTINLKQYYPFCKEDIFVEVSDEIVEAFLLDKRAEAARDRKMFRYKALKTEFATVLAELKRIDTRRKPTRRNRQ